MSAKLQPYELPPDLPELLMPVQVAEIFHVDRKTVKVWADKGLLQFTRTLGGHRRYYRDDVARVLRETYVACATPSHGKKVNVPPGPARSATSLGDGQLSRKEALRILGVHQRTLQRWTNAGRLGFTTTLGGHRRFDEAEVRALAAARPRQKERSR